MCVALWIRKVSAKYRLLPIPIALRFGRLYGVFYVGNFVVVKDNVFICKC